MEALSARMEEIAAKVEALTARMDALSPSSPPTDSQRSPPSQMRAEAPTIPSLFSFGSASKGFDFSKPSPKNQASTAPKGFASFLTSAKDFGLPKQSQPTTSPSTPPNSGSHGLFGNLHPRTGSAQSQTNVSSPPLMIPSALAVNKDFILPNRAQTRGNSTVPLSPSSLLPLRDSPQGINMAQTPSPSTFASVRTESETGSTSPAPSETYVSSSTSEAPSQPQGTRDKSSAKASSESSSANPGTAVHSPIIVRPSSLGSSGKDSGSLTSSQLVHDFHKSLTIGSNAVGVIPPVRTGSFHPRYAPYSLQDPEQASIINDYQSISCIPAYRGTSFEELRVQDYAQGRKTANTFAQSAASGGVQDLRTEPRISYSSSNFNNEAWIRQRLIDAKEPILFVGESKNRSLPVALAIMRESWDGIWASSLYKQETQKLSALLASSQDRSQINAGFVGRLKKSLSWKSVAEMRYKLSELTNALDPKSHDEVADRLFLVADATRLKTSIQGPTRNIWFQCPWISRMDNITTTAKLLAGFISSAATIQQSGDVVFLGLTAHTAYRNAYDLDNFKKVARSLGYEILIDEWFILHAIDAGYKHESVATTDIHRLLIDDHQTFVLVKREHSEHTWVKEQISTQRKELEAQLKELELHLRDLHARENELSLVDEAMTSDRHGYPATYVGGSRTRTRPGIPISPLTSGKKLWE
ncbi:hypothetical protein DFH08DRAFT_938887 [Mycena albidolilacea]|uniref:Uncharacterized protein n=1 Tax=Mycena albidolilacea TaxID=1033008 RepID=A0AAD6ZTT0_9AGAR|nr:hypothetical protein DFH08DRAFT_938887 [Mycena albidolilacea]